MLVNCVAVFSLNVIAWCNEGFGVSVTDYIRDQLKSVTISV